MKVNSINQVQYKSENVSNLKQVNDQKNVSFSGPFKDSNDIIQITSPLLEGKNCVNKPKTSLLKKIFVKRNVDVELSKKFNFSKEELKQFSKKEKNVLMNAKYNEHNYKLMLDQFDNKNANRKIACLSEALDKNSVSKDDQSIILNLANKKFEV